MITIEIPVRELHARTGHYVRKAASHVEVVVTERGVPAARLTPFSFRSRGSGDDHQGAPKTSPGIPSSGKIGRLQILGRSHQGGGAWPARPLIPPGMIYCDTAYLLKWYLDEEGAPRSAT